MESKQNRAVKVNFLPESEVEIESELSAEEVVARRGEALKRLNQETKLDGFRPGHIPEKVLVDRLGEIAVWEEAVRLVIGKIYPQILDEHKVEAIGRPEIIITKLTPNQPVSFKIKTAVVPEVKLPDYNAIAKKVGGSQTADPEATDKDILEAVKTIRQQFKLAQKSKEGGLEAEKDVAKTEKNDGPLTDEEVRRWGDFTDVADFNEKIKKLIAEDKAREQKEKKRIAIIEGILKETNIAMPKLLIEHELGILESRFANDLKNMGTTVEEYAKNIKKTPEEIRESMRPNALKKAKLQLVLNEIAKNEKIKVTTEEVEKESSHIREHYPDADPESVTIYAATILGNEKVFEFLENQK